MPAVFKVERRNELGKEKVKKLRKQGLLPAIVYGPHIDPIPVKLPFSRVHEIIKEYAHDLIELDIEGEKLQVVLKDVQWDYIKQIPLHLDFYNITAGEEFETTVPLKFVGEPRGIRKGGIVEYFLHEVEILTTPDKLPHFIEVDVSALDVGDVLLVRDISLPEGVKILNEPEETVVVVTAPGAVEVEEVEVEEEPESPEVIKKGKFEEE